MYAGPDNFNGVLSKVAARLRDYFAKYDAASRGRRKFAVLGECVFFFHFFEYWNAQVWIFLCADWKTSVDCRTVAYFFIFSLILLFYYYVTTVCIQLGEVRLTL